ncbi:MAG: hypothetical protein F6K57_39110, partial [Moorea sp. SIO4A5]|nr:hypothetical protein [Moorena sp. SIO4A5]
RPGDGHHRIKAAALAEQQILCEVRIGKLIDAIRYSCSSNQRPSLHRTNADKRRAVEMMFQTLIEEFGSLDAIPRSQGGKRKGLDWTNRRIAEHVGVSAATVDNIHSELELTAKIVQFTEGDRVEVIEDKNLPNWASPGKLGTVSGKDKKLGLLVNWDNDTPQHIHPDKVQQTDLPASAPTPAPKSNEPAQVSTPVAKGIENEPAPTPTPVPKSKQEAELDQKDSQVPPDVPPEVPHNPAPVLDESEEFFTLSPESETNVYIENIATVVINNAEHFAEHFSHEQVRVILEALVAKHGMGMIDDILNSLEQQQVG